MSIILRDLCYSYGEKDILKNISLVVNTGDHIGIDGISGGGKSTLLKLISGLYTPTSGFINVQGATVPAEIRKKVSVVMQTTMLLPVSIRENITCGHEMEMEQIWHACEAAQLLTWIQSLKDGIDTDVGERGSKISGGQAQRIAIARAIAKNAPVVLLDEATSALDRKTGDAVLSAFLNLTKGKTVISVSHKFDSLSDFEHIYHLEGGQLLYA